MFLHGSGSSLCDSRSASYFDRSHTTISRYRSDDLRTSTTPSTMAMTRKRPRVDSHHFHDAPTPDLFTTGRDLGDSVSSFGLASPSPLANTDYRLFGGLDTPGTWSELREERAHMDDAERDYRLNRFNQRVQQSFLADQSSLRRSRNGQTAEHDSTSLTGWHLRRTAWALTGGLAGKIFNFCWNTTFRGFQAGAGPAYNFQGSDATDFAQDRNHLDCRDEKRLDSHSCAFHEMHSRNTQPQHAEVFQRTVKTPVSYKRQISEDSMVKNNWVFVETTPGSPEEQSPVRKRSRASVAGLYSRSSSTYTLNQPQTQNTTHIPQPTQTSRAYTASFASPRSRTTSFTSRTSIPTATVLSPKPKRPRVAPTYASPTRRQTAHIMAVPQSPISPEIETYQRKRRKEEKRQDDSLKRLNATLQDMIREGQQALGSKIEIVDDFGHAGEGDEYDMDEGYFGDDMR